MSPISREFLSQSNNGSYIPITASGSPGTLIHTATSTPGQKDEVWLWGTNNTGDIVSLTVEWAGVDPNADLSNVGMPSTQGRQLLIAGETVGNGVDIRVYSDQPSATVSGVTIGGHVNRIS